MILVGLQNAMEGWASFTDDMQRYYGVRMDCLNDSFRDEQKQYYQQTAAWADVSPQQAGRPALVLQAVRPPQGHPARRSA